MLERPDKDVLEALAALDHNSNYAVIMDWLRRSQTNTHSVLTNADAPVVIHRHQGANQLLSELIDLSTNARTLLSKGSK